MASPWFVYLVRCNDDSLYTGISTDVERRLGDHGGNRGARRLKGRGPLRLVFAEAVGDHATALRIEFRLKRWRKADKERLVRGEIGLPEID